GGRHMQAEQHEAGTYKIAADRTPSEREQRRLDALARQLDPGTQRILQTRGVAPGWRCLEVGGGSGSVARWLAERVVPGGSVLSTGVGPPFHPGSQGALALREPRTPKDGPPAGPV